MNLFQLLQANARAVRPSIPDLLWLDQQLLLNLLCDGAEPRCCVQLSLAR
ncbi:MAG: hypothetical protein KJ556_18815 [Gammaproteobacteria bacterium]|nr:hypothetical protein [Gammaproteobacteria bacterium]MBU2058787.1 hypothetical protein [Gammaproteobacteria bacterium]MBU2177150.1 hypothetical protein [Gammaproteobacteria bacterium]MBU2247136.1 hypothetical protein [Gammaproteobacteria bacterium]MBU2343628.1 hypothetical protein [Gammaproteobacteria bacterium]